MNVLIVGNQGNMGRRYSSICEYLGYTVVGFDLPIDNKAFKSALKVCQHIIVATPTAQHQNSIAQICEAKDPAQYHVVLCEKPLTKTLTSAGNIYGLALRSNVELFVVNQYAHLPEASRFKGKNETTHYSYFKSGNDGLDWDCFQLYALANGQVSLSNDSPVWSCVINGEEIDISNMDKSYIKMIQDFATNRQNMWGERIVVDTTRKVIRAIERRKNGKNGNDRNPGSKRLN